jgi:hypothetical protein
MRCAAKLHSLHIWMRILDAAMSFGSGALYEFVQEFLRVFAEFRSSARDATRRSGKPRGHAGKAYRPVF